MKTRSIILFLTLLTVTLLIGGVSLIRLDGISTLKNDQLNNESQVKDSLQFIQYISDYKAYFFSPITNRKQLKAEKDKFLSIHNRWKENASLSFDYRVIENLQESFFRSQSLVLQKRKELETIEKQVKQKWERVILILEREILKRLKRKKDFLPNLKQKLSEWSKTLPILNELRSSLDVSYVEKGKLDEVRDIMGFTQWVLTKRIKNDLSKEEFLLELENSKLGVVEKTELKLYYSEVLEKKKEELKIKKELIHSKSELKALLKVIDQELQSKIIPAWQEKLAQQNNSLIEKRSKKHQLTVDTSTALATVVILILFLYTRKLGKEEAKNLKLNDSIQKMRRITERGEFAAKTAHEIKNPLSILTFCLTDALESVIKGDTKKARQELSKSMEAVERLKLISQNLRSMNSQNEAINLDLVQLLKDVSVTYQSWLQSEGIELRIKFNTKKAIVKGSRLEFMGALSNLIDNAIEFLIENPDISQLIEVEIRTTQVGHRLTVQNGGPQVEDPQKIFHNFYSSKKGVDRGLGLSIVKDIVENAEGYIEYSYRNGQNTFSLNFDQKA